jgi:hypothetical protein
MKTKRALLLATACAIGALGAACFQELDPNATSGGPLFGDDGGANGGTSTWDICAAPSCDTPDGGIPYLDQTPPIYLPEGGTTTDPCASVGQAAMALRRTYCASCHEAPNTEGNLGVVLDDAKLAAAVSQTAKDDAGYPLPLIVPGDPSRSWLYQRVAQGMSGAATGMPPVAAAGMPPNPRPSASDMSILYGWIAFCVPGASAGADAGADARAGASADAGAGADASDAGTGG